VVTESLLDEGGSSLSSVLIFLDFSTQTAFNTVNHQILLSTLAELGITGSALSWFTSYLTGHTYRVTWNGSLSRPCTLDTGVPQGSELGPLLFSLCARCLGSVITSHYFSYNCYTDDPTVPLLPLSDTQIATHISKCLADISKETTANHLKLNLDKTELFFMPGKDCPQMDLLVTTEDIEVSPAPTAGTLAWYWMTRCPATPTSPLSVDLVGFLLTTSARFGPSSHVKRSSSLASTTATLSWLDSLPPLSNPYNASRTQQRSPWQTPAKSQLFPVLAPQWWNKLPARMVHDGSRSPQVIQDPPGHCITPA